MEIGKLTEIFLIVVAVIAVILVFMFMFNSLAKFFPGLDIDYQKEKERIDNIQTNDFNNFINLFDKCKNFKEQECLCSTGFGLQKGYLLKMANIDDGIKLWIEDEAQMIIGEPKIMRGDKIRVCTNERRTKIANLVDYAYVDDDGTVFTDKGEYKAEGIQNGGIVSLFKTVSDNLCIVVNPVGNPTLNENVEQCRN